MTECEAALHRTISPYGAWKSPISPGVAAGASLRLSEVRLLPGLVTWIESRPHEGGRSVIVGAPLRASISDSEAFDLIPEGSNARNTVHEYGGGSYDLTESLLVYSNFGDQGIYTSPVTSPIVKPGLRYGDLTLDPHHEWIWCVRESHLNSSTPVNEVVHVVLAGPEEGNAGQAVVSGSDFYAYPRPSPDGSWLAWISWNHPNMPWDGTELWVARIEPGPRLGEPIRVAGGIRESVFQPSWSPKGELCFVSDRSGWWNLYRTEVDRWHHHDCLYEAESEFGEPLWQLGASTYAFASPDVLIATRRSPKSTTLIAIDIASGDAKEIETGYSSFSSLAGDGSGGFAFIGGRHDRPAEVAVYRGEDLAGTFGATSPIVDRSFVSEPQAIEFATTDGDTAYAWYYPPLNPNFKAPKDELPPLITMSHGGPTAATSTDFRPDIQFWTSRGFAVVDVNYRGSTSYGRPYRDRLKGKWGIYDVDDCAAAAKYLATSGEVDPDRMAIRGRSAGGYTTLCALAFRDVFAAGASYYGIADAEILTRETHKFEAHYLDSLIGPYPEDAATYRERSPIHFADQITCPVIFFQGLDDQVVPPDQAEMMVAALRERGLRHAYIEFEGEQHGFRKAGNIERALTEELSFYAAVFKLSIP